MARNRKRAKDRRSRRPTTDPPTGRGIATARGARGPAADHGPAPEREPTPETEPLDPATPEAIEHATPDVELAEAQLALGRAEAADDGYAVDAEGSAGPREEFADPGEEFADPGEEYADPGEDEADSDRGEGAGPPRSGGLTRSGGGAPAPRSLPGGRLITFLQGSWRELQRVQWPDRRQVMQATGVVIGFVIIAGLFLGLADLVATNVVNFILK